MRTTLDLLRPTYQPPRQQLKHNRNFEAGSQVYAKVYSSNEVWKWMPGVVIERIGNVNYNILLDHQIGRRKVLRSHIDQLKSRSGDEPATLVEPFPLSILVQDFGLQQQIVPAQSNDEAVIPVPVPDEVPEQHPASVVNEPLPEEDSNVDQELEETLQADFHQGPSSCSTPMQQQLEPNQRPLRSVRLPKKLQEYICY